MLLILVVIFEITAVTLYLNLARYYLYLFIFFIYVIFWYLSGAEETGNESKAAFRRWGFWKKFTAVEYSFGNVEEFSKDDRRMLFVLVTNATNMPLISGFGLHGGVFKDIDVCYMMPPIFFKIPIIREFLLWSGGVTGPQKDFEGTILKLLRKGKSVAYCPTGMANYMSQGVVNDITTKIDQSIFEFAREHQISLVPVLVNGEHERYTFMLDYPLVNRLRAFCLKHFRIPFPIAFIPKIFGANPPPFIQISVGIPMNPTIQQSNETFNTLFNGQIKGMLGV